MFITPILLDLVMSEPRKPAELNQKQVQDIYNFVRTFNRPEEDEQLYK